MIIGGKDTPTISGVKGLDTVNINLKLIETKAIGPGMLLHYKLIK
jgi:riboflavin biosynthesis pyrimidine reductase